MPSPAARGAGPDPTPLGSLTQARPAVVTGCSACGGTSVTRITLRLTDGTPVELTSCHRCEHRSWTEHGKPVSVTSVLAKARKPR